MIQGDRELSGTSSPVLMGKRCNGCGICIEVCPSFVFSRAHGTVFVAKDEWCIGCGHCTAVCPQEAIIHEAASKVQTTSSGEKSAISAGQLMRLLRERRSVRLYKKKKPSHKVLAEIIEAARYAPTGSNSQNVRYIVLTDRERIAELRGMAVCFYERVFRLLRNGTGGFLLGVFAGRRLVAKMRESLPKLEHARWLMSQGRDPLLYHAPVVMVVHAEAWDTTSPFNCALALYNASLMAHTMGVGCCFNGYIQAAINGSKRIRRWLGIPKGHRCYGAMTLGYQKVRYLRLVERKKAMVAWR